MLTPRFGKFLVYGSGDVRKHASPNHARASLKLIVEPGLYMLLRFQKAAVRGNYETGNQAFSKRLRFLTIRDVTTGKPSARTVASGTPHFPEQDFWPAWLRHRAGGVNSRLPVTRPGLMESTSGAWHD
jgi:hypothetical protein